MVQLTNELCMKVHISIYTSHVNELLCHLQLCRNEQEHIFEYNFTFKVLEIFQYFANYSLIASNAQQFCLLISRSMEPNDAIWSYEVRS